MKFVTQKEQRSKKTTPLRLPFKDGSNLTPVLVLQRAQVANLKAKLQKCNIASEVMFNMEKADVQERGTLTYSMFKQVILQLCPQMTHGDMSVLLAQIDPTQSGCVDYKRLLRFLASATPEISSRRLRDKSPPSIRHQMSPPPYLAAKRGVADSWRQKGRRTRSPSRSRKTTNSPARPRRSSASPQRLRRTTSPIAMRVQNKIRQHGIRKKQMTKNKDDMDPVYASTFSQARKKKGSSVGKRKASATSTKRLSGTSASGRSTSVSGRRPPGQLSKSAKGNGRSRRNSQRTGRRVVVASVLAPLGRTASPAKSSRSRRSASPGRSRSMGRAGVRRAGARKAGRKVPSSLHNYFRRKIKSRNIDKGN